jgi:hypothetical protein
LPLDFNRLLDTDQRLRWNRFVLAVLGRPSSIAGLWGLHRRSRAGAELLSRALVRVISPESRAGATQVERGT